MSNQEGASSLSVLRNQIADFEKTIVNLQESVTKLKKVLNEKEKLFGSNPDKWPEGK